MLPATRGTFNSSETAQTPAVKSNNFPTSPSSERCKSLITATGSAPITHTSLRAALVTWNPPRNGYSLKRECIPSTAVVTYTSWDPTLFLTTPPSSCADGFIKALEWVLETMSAIFLWTKKSPFPLEPTPISPILTSAL